MSFSSTCKLPIVGSDVLCIVNSEWSSKSVKLLVLHDNQAWSGKFQVVEDEDTTDLLDQLSMTEDEYIEETKKALTTHGGAEGFAYTIDCDKFTWKKEISKNMAVKFGYTILKKVSAFNVFEEIIDNTLQENLELRTKLERSTQKNDTFTEENEHLKSKLNDLIERKSEMESSLYSQFVYLLNEKKRRINELQKQFQPSNEGENEPGVTQSDSDPFGSDTELDSEEEEQSHSKAGSKDSVLADEDDVCMLAKRLKTPTKIDSVAGPSGVCQKRKDKGGVSKSPSNEQNKITSKGKKPLKFSCVMENVPDKKQDSPDEDVFAFPKRSKRITGCAERAKPSTSRLKYDSDDEMPLDKTKNIEIDSDSTPNGIEPIDIIKTITVKTPLDINTANLNGRNDVSKSERSFDEDSIDRKKSDTVQDPNFKDFSNSTLEILNQLI